MYNYKYVIYCVCIYIYDIYALCIHSTNTCIAKPGQGASCFAPLPGRLGGKFLCVFALGRCSTWGEWMEQRSLCKSWSISMYI